MKACSPTRSWEDNLCESMNKILETILRYNLNCVYTVFKITADFTEYQCSTKVLFGTHHCGNKSSKIFWRYFKTLSQRLNNTVINSYYSHCFISIYMNIYHHYFVGLHLSISSFLVFQILLYCTIYHLILIYFLFLWPSCS